ncbi:MAG: hypothetical protein F4179_04645 [Gammaproteobacteria bacterium]|nr:hypothetical protein [Gammaproteobacteria bacterium]MYF60951.1 hypothetical protein [Gammaproteobacteria bacterium]
MDARRQFDGMGRCPSWPGWPRRSSWWLFTAGLLLTVAAASLLPSRGSAQEEMSGPDPEDSLLRVFLDCEPWMCDFDHLRREVSFVNYVRDRTDADLHVLVTSQETAAGGEAYEMYFMGLEERAAQQDTLYFVSQESDSEEEERAGLTQIFTLGLVRYAASTSAGPLLDISYEAREQMQQQASAGTDPWNLWVFSIRAGAELEGESRESAQAFDGSFWASRTTEDLKIDISSYAEYEEERFELNDEEVLVSTSRNFNHEGLVVWSLGPHWSAGVRASALTSTRVNQDLAIRAAPALQYSIFPYAESTRRQITFLYSLGLASFDYEEVTLFDKTKESHAEQRMEISGEFQQPWGDINSGLEASMFLHDPSLHRIDLYARVEYRIVRGLNLDLEGSVARVKDQIYLSREGIPDEEILLERRQLGTDFEYELEIGFSFTFGSVFNNVVNPRMGSNRGRRFF